MIDRYQPYSDDKIRAIHGNLTEVAPPTPRQPPDEREREWLYGVFQPETLTDELFILETESWVKKMKSTEFLPFLAAYRTLLEQMTDTNRLEVADPTCQWSEVWTQDQEIGIAYHYRPELKRILLLEPLRPSFDTVMLNGISQKCAKQQTLSGIAVRSYPFLMVIDTDAWIAIQKDEESNLALSPEEAKLVEAVHGSGVDAAGGYPLFINGRAGSGKSTMLQYLAADYVDFALRGDASLLPLYMTCSKDLLSRARETVQGLVMTHHKRLLETKVGGVDQARLALLFQDSFWVFHEYLYSLLPSDRTDSFPRDHYVTYAAFRRLWNDQFARRPVARSLSPEVCWHVIRSYVKGIRSSRSDDLGPLEFEALGRRRRSVDIDTYERIYSEVWEAWYKPLCDDRGYWDDQDLAADVLDIGLDEDCGRAAIFCDEAQDFTPVELDVIFQLSLFSRRSLQPDDLRRVPIIFAGDPLQTINPTGFRWDTVKAYFHERFCAVVDPSNSSRSSNREINLNYRELLFNYRSNSGIVRFCNLLQLARAALLEGTDIHPQEPWWIDQFVQPVWFDVDSTETINQLCNHPELVKLVDCLDGEETTFVSEDQRLRRLEKSEDIYRNVMSPTRAKGLEFPAVVLYRFGESAPGDFMQLLNTDVDLDDPKQGLPWEYFFNRLYVAASRAKARLIVVDSKETVERFWKFATDPDVFDRLFQMMASDERWRQATGSLMDGTDEVWSGEYFDQREQAASFVSQGLRNHDSYLLRQAGLAYRSVGDQHTAEKCFACADEYDGKSGEAGDRFTELGLHEDAARCYWSGDLWRRLKNIARRQKSLVADLRVRVADFMLDDGAPSVAFLKQLNSAVMDTKWLQDSSADPTWNKVFVEILKRLRDTSSDLSIQWNAVLDTFVRVASAGVRMSHSDLAELAYRSRNFELAKKYWDSDRNSAHEKYHRAAAHLASYPDSIVLWGDLEEYAEVIRIWRKQSIRQTAIEKAPAEVIHTVVDAALIQNELSLAAGIIEVRPDRDRMGQLLRQGIRDGDGGVVHTCAVAAGRFFVRSRAWTDVVDATDLTSVAALAGTHDITLGQHVHSQQEMRRDVLVAMVWELAESDDLSEESAKLREPVARFLRRHFISGTPVCTIPPRVVGAAIERAGKIVDALQFYENLFEDDSTTADTRRFAVERLIRNLERHVEYFQHRGDIEEAQQRALRSRQLREREGVGDRELTEYPEVRKSQHDPQPRPTDEADRSSSFWDMRTLEELARSQNVTPVTDVDEIFGTWPGEEDDGFEQAIEELRHPKEFNV